MRLVIDRVSKSYLSRKVLKSITAEAQENQLLGIVGPNGSGKSTLIKIIASLIRPSSGTVLFENDGKKIKGSDILSFVGLVSPDLFLYDELTALENIRFLTSMSGLALNDAQKRFAEFGLGGREHDLVRSYSSGMKQRLKLMLAVSRRPPILLLDEPTANLDEAGKALVRNIIENHVGITVLASNDRLEVAGATVVIDLASQMAGGSV